MVPKMYFPWLWIRWQISYQLWDPEIKQVVQSSNVVFNKSEMQKLVERPVEVKRVTFSDALMPLDDPMQHTRVATREATSTGQSTARANTSIHVDSESGLSNDPQSGVTTQGQSSMMIGQAQSSQENLINNLSHR